jgi:hypothetical protein
MVRAIAPRGDGFVGAPGSFQASSLIGSARSPTQELSIWW